MDSYSVKAAIAAGDFFDTVRILYNDKYQYDLKVKVTRPLQVIKVTCPVHGDFQTTALSHLRGHGCVLCK